MIVAFDVDGTLLTYENRPRHEVIDLLRWFKRNGDMIIIWSGGGKDYAEHWADRLGLNVDLISNKGSQEATELGIDISVDDEEVKLGKVNLKV